LAKRLTIARQQSISFVDRSKFFGLPDDLPSMVSDFRKFIYDERCAFNDGIASMSRSGFSVNDEFDTRLPMPSAHGWRRAPHRDECDCHERHRSDLPDRIAAKLAGDSLRIWIVE